MKNSVTLLALEEGRLTQKMGDGRVVEKGVGCVLCDDSEVDLEEEKGREEDIALGFLRFDQKDEWHVVDDRVDGHDR